MYLIRLNDVSEVSWMISLVLVLCGCQKMLEKHFLEKV